MTPYVDRFGISGALNGYYLSLAQIDVKASTEGNVEKIETLITVGMSAVTMKRMAQAMLRCTDKYEEVYGNLYSGGDDPDLQPDQETKNE